MIELTLVDYLFPELRDKSWVNRHNIAFLEPTKRNWKKKCGCYQGERDMTLIHFTGGHYALALEDIETVKKLARIKK